MNDEGGIAEPETFVGIWGRIDIIRRMQYQRRYRGIIEEL